MTQLLHAKFKDETGTMRKLTRGELLAMINMLATAGNETTNRLIGWTGKVLAEHPEQRREIAKNPGMIPAVIAEVLRFESPGPHAARYVTRDAAVQGVKIPQGSYVNLLVGAPHRDPRPSFDGDRFAGTRQSTPPLA